MRFLVISFVIMTCSTASAAGQNRRSHPFPHLMDHLNLLFAGDWLTAKSPASYYDMLKAGDDPTLIRGSQILVEDFLSKGVLHLKWRSGKHQRSQQLHELVSRKFPEHPNDADAIGFLLEMVSAIVSTLRETFPESWGQNERGYQIVSEPDGLLQRGRLLSLVVLAKLEGLLAGDQGLLPPDLDHDKLTGDLHYLWGNRRVGIDRDCSTRYLMMALPQAACGAAVGSLIANLPYPEGATEMVTAQLRWFGGQVPVELGAPWALLPKQLTDVGEVLGAATAAARDFVSSTFAEGTGHRLRECGSLPAREGLKELLQGSESRGGDDSEWQIVDGLSSAQPAKSR